MKIPIGEYAVVQLEARVLRAYEVCMKGGVRRWVVWCDHCKIWHWHGPQEGHREAHCSDVTPYTKTGYNLALRGKWREYFAGNSPDDC